MDSQPERHSVVVAHAGPNSVASPTHVQIAIPTATGEHKGVLSAAELDAIQNQRLALRRQRSFSDVIQGTFGAKPVKLFLYAWSVVVILMGLGILAVGLYLLYFQENAHMMPALAYYVAAFTGVCLALISGLGLYGLQQQRRCVTEGRRNYALGVYILLSLVGSAIIIMGGIVALTLRGVVKHAQVHDFALQKVRYFETAVIMNLHEYVEEDPRGWREIQRSQYCCGYTNVNTLRDTATLPWDDSLLTMVDEINTVAGIYCAKTASQCADTVGFPCPVNRRAWCRSEFHLLMLTNYRLIGAFALVVGAAQILSSGLSLFTLLCDVRMLPRRSPAREVLRHQLSPLRKL
uniref:Tetraspanin n=1 Tax=Globisporangium ultimum (strain ATCC 200006 / CBS 805.95 / DAOM BR144) TaxID=431595 RepID=K3WC10_GLOUD